MWKYVKQQTRSTTLPIPYFLPRQNSLSATGNVFCVCIAVDVENDLVTNRFSVDDVDPDDCGITWHSQI